MERVFSRQLHAAAPHLTAHRKKLKALNGRGHSNESIKAFVISLPQVLATCKLLTGLCNTPSNLLLKHHFSLFN